LCRKNPRRNRASETQLFAMIDFFESHKGMAEDKFMLMNGRDELKKMWAKLTQELNALGVKKTVTPKKNNI